MERIQDFYADKGTAETLLGDIYVVDTSTDRPKDIDSLDG